MDETVSLASDFVPSKAALHLVKGGNSMQFTVKLANRSTEPYSPTIYHVSVTGPLGRVQCEGIFDEAKQVGTPPQADVAPGKSVTLKVAFSCPAEIAVGSAIEVATDSGLPSDTPDPVFVGVAA